MPASYDIFPFTEDPIIFNEDKLGKVDPGLAAPQGFKLRPDELKNIFGIDKDRFASLPKRMVIPDLYGKHHADNWYSCEGWLYMVEPIEWIPVVRSEGTIPASMFKTEYEKTEISKSETTFTASTMASVTLEGGGSYMGVTASAKSESEVKFEVQRSNYIEEQWKTKGETGQLPIHKLFVYPLLKVRVVKRQRIEFTINDSSSELKWTGDSYRDGYWGERQVSNGRLRHVRTLQLHPIPMSGWACPSKGYILPVPKVDDKGKFSITTIMSRAGWVDWYVYDHTKWEDYSAERILAAPNNDGAFRPMYTVIPLKEPA